MDNDYYSFITWEKERMRGQELCDHLNPPRSRNASEIPDKELVAIELAYRNNELFKEHNGTPPFRWFPEKMWVSKDLDTIYWEK